MIPPNPEFIGVGCRGKWRSFSAVLTVNPKKTRIQGNSVTRPLAVSLPRPLTKRVKGLEDQMSKIKMKNKMIKTISKLCEINFNQINIKGKTTEKLGLIGKEKAIASEVITSVNKYD